MDPVAILQDYRASVVDWETLLAHVTAHTTWQVPLDASGAPLKWEREIRLDGTPTLFRAICAMVECALPTDFPTPDSWQTVTGQTLMEQIIDQGTAPATALILEAGKPWERSFIRDLHFAELRQAASIPMVERVLENPAPHQASCSSIISERC